MPKLSELSWARKKTRAKRKSKMPLYEYECSCGKTFELLKSIENRHDTICECGRVPILKISSWGRVFIAAPFTVVGPGGNVLSRTQSTERTAILGVEEP